MTSSSGEETAHQFELYPWLLAVGVLISRVLITGPIYFLDGPAHVDAARERTYLIQPPGYWLFNRIIACFLKPEEGIVFLNWTFSVLGVVAFYYAARLLVKKQVAQLGAAVYAVVFFDWFTGGIHSTYASQLLFPVLLFLFLQLHSRQPRLVYLMAAAISYAIGAGFRPVDGLFLGWMFLYYLVRRAPGRQALLSFSVAAVLCLVWLVPTLEGFASQWGASSTVAYSANSFARDSPIFHGITLRSMANVARFAVPLTIAFWPLLGSILGTFSKLHNESVGLLWIWIAPGAAFMVLIYMGDAPYLTYLTAAVLLLALKQLDSAAPRLRTLLVAFCAAFNIVFFLFFVPIRSKSFAVNVLNLYAGKYTRFAIRNQWQPNLSDLIDRNTLQPRQ